MKTPGLYVGLGSERATQTFAWPPHFYQFIRNRDIDLTYMYLGQIDKMQLEIGKNNF